VWSFLLFDIEQFIDFSHHIAFCVFDQHLEERFDLGLSLRGGADFGDLFLGEFENRFITPLPGFLKRMLAALSHTM
jgi:hypothetical protein